MPKIWRASVQRIGILWRLYNYINTPANDNQNVGFGFLGFLPINTFDPPQTRDTRPNRVNWHKCYVPHLHMLRRNHAIFSDDSKKLLQRKCPEQYIISCRYICWPYMYTPPVQTEKNNMTPEEWWWEDACLSFLGMVIFQGCMPSAPAIWINLVGTSTWMTFEYFSATYPQQSPLDGKEGALYYQPKACIKWTFPQNCHGF